MGLGLEAIWCYVFLNLWLRITRRSELVQCNRSATGPVRAIMDLAGAIRRDVGDNAGAYGDKQLRKELEKCDPLGYRVKEREDGVMQVKLVSVPEGRRARGRFRVDREKMYG